MSMIIYGTRVFTKNVGYYGNQEECQFCHKIYKKGYVKNTVWVHLEYLPLFPVKTVYFKMCPVCGNGFELDKKTAKQEMQDRQDTTGQNLEVYAKHILADKPKGIMSVDTSYELWVKDVMTGEDICLATGLTKDNVKDTKKARGLKKIPIQDV